MKKLTRQELKNVLGGTLESTCLTFTHDGDFCDAMMSKIMSSYQALAAAQQAAFEQMLNDLNTRSVLSSTGSCLDSYYAGTGSARCINQCFDAAYVC